MLLNRGQSVVFRLSPGQGVNLTGGPLVYAYRFEELFLHFGSSDEQGSEHRINGHAFPGEVIINSFLAVFSHFQ